MSIEQGYIRYVRMEMDAGNNDVMTYSEWSDDQARMEACIG